MKASPRSPPDWRTRSLYFYKRRLDLPLNIQSRSSSGREASGGTSRYHFQFSPVSSAATRLSEINLSPPPAQRAAGGSGRLQDNVCKPSGRGCNDTFLTDGETRSQLTARLRGLVHKNTASSGRNASLSDVEDRQEASAGGRPPPLALSRGCRRWEASPLQQSPQPSSCFQTRGFPSVFQIGQKMSEVLEL